MAVGDTMGHPEAQEDREQSGHMGGYEAAPMGHPGETPSLGVTAHLTLVSVRLYRQDTQLVPERGSDNVAAEASGLMDNRLCSAYVPASPSECAVSTGLCLPRSGAPALAGDRRDNDDYDARTTHSPDTGVPGVSGTSVLAKLQIPSDWGTQATPELDRSSGLFTWQLALLSHVHGENSPVGPLNSRQIENSVGETSGNLLRETSGNVVGETFGGTYGEKSHRRIDHVAT